MEGVMTTFGKRSGRGVESSSIYDAVGWHGKYSLSWNCLQLLLVVIHPVCDIDNFIDELSQSCLPNSFTLLLLLLFVCL